MRLKEIPEADWGTRVSVRMTDLVRFLNQMVVADPEAITKLLDENVVPVYGAEIDKVAPYAVVREGGFMSGLGLLSAFVNTEDRRIFAVFENDEEPYGNIVRFGVYEVLPDA